MYRTVGKRFFDVLGSTFLLFILSPVFVGISIFGAVANRGNPFFVQERVGLDEKVFKVVKFKTMNNRRDSHGHLLPDGERLTSYGRKLRSTSLDEIPQLFNVLKGDMSFVGPRPLLVRYLPHYSSLERRRHTVRPGITGFAQIKGRNDLSWATRFAYDVEYVRDLSLMTDFRILVQTLAAVASASGVKTDVTTTGLRDLDDERRN